ncbi:MAG: haloacid dehalogenase [Cyanobacteria bacterium J06560_2]
MVNQVILTALDGALLSSVEVGAPIEVTQTAAQGDLTKIVESDYKSLREAIAQLKASDVPVVVFTQRDRVEIEPIRQQLGLTSPFIVESGSAIFASANQHPFGPGVGETEDGYFVVTLGCPYVQARAGLRVLANMISHPLKGFGDFTVPQLEKSAKLSETAAHQAKAREFSELFMTPKAIERELLRQAAEDMGFEVILREPKESRFSELLGAGAGLPAAVKELLSAYQSLEAGEALQVIAVSSRSADLAALAKVKRELDIEDWKEVLVDGHEAWVEAIAPLLPN